MLSVRLTLLLLFVCSIIVAQEPKVGEALPAWQEGYLDLHHINTGRGNAAFFILPDGTNFVVDAGELDPTTERVKSGRDMPIRPNAGKPPFEWLAEYIRQFAPQHKNTRIDYALITHFHDDHFGSWYAAAPFSTDHQFQRTGITGLADVLGINTLLTRDYHYPVDPDSVIKKLGSKNPFSKTWTNYQAFIKDLTAKGMRTEWFQAGSATQVRLLHSPQRYPDFQIRNLKSNGSIWTGTDSTVKQHFPPIDLQNPKSWPDENTLSNALLLSYGAFRYYTGGDNAGTVFFGDSSWRDVESDIARVTGPVDVSTMDHHGNRDAVNDTLVKILQPRVWIEQVWTADHPGHEVLIRVMSALYPGPRDLFATNMHEANKTVIGPLVDKSYKSQQGHILVRVMPGGKTYYVIILNDMDTTRKVKAVFGPYQSKKSTS